MLCVYVASTGEKPLWAMYSQRHVNTLCHRTLQIFFYWVPCNLGGPGSVVGIATGYGMDGPEIESRWGRDFPLLSRPALGPTQPLVQWIPSHSRG